MTEDRLLLDCVIYDVIECDDPFSTLHVKVIIQQVISGMEQGILHYAKGIRGCYINFALYKCFYSIHPCF